MLQSRLGNQQGAIGLYRFYQLTNPENKKYFDFLPSLLEKKYLKTIYRCHEYAGSLNKTDIDGDGFGFYYLNAG